MKEIYDNICAGRDLRANLISLKKLLKDAENRKQFRLICGEEYDVIMKCLVDADPKVRKNAAAVLGLLKAQSALDVLYDAWEAEDTLFVRSGYVAAMAALDCSEYLDAFRKRLKELEAYDAREDEGKHVAEEISALRRLLLDKEGIVKHRFT
ncbi:MAG: HEAT repeat domain-containing protein, partial [Clostridiales bacterium]|nr:HEAT repeat domain-containing protein [Clostridiales bacterium]